MEFTLTDVKLQPREQRRSGTLNGRYWSEYTPYRTHLSKPRLYVSLEGEGVLDDFANRFDRPVRAYRPFAEAALRQLGIDYEKLAWSQKAGCSCGCSPGFIVTLPQEGYY